MLYILKRFGDAESSVTKSTDSLITGHAQVQSCKQRFKECAKHWTYVYAFGASLGMHTATPFR